MPFLEKSNWVVLVISLAMLCVYGGAMAAQVASRPIAEIDWVQPMIYSIVIFIVANIVGNILVAMTNPKEADRKDQRDRDIDRFGERIGNWVIIGGACAALVLAMADADRFWIAHAIYIAGIVAAGLSAVTKIVGYHAPFQRW